MEAEMSEHLVYEPYERSESENARNGTYNKNPIVFMQYSAAIRKVIYTTKSIESVNSQLRKLTNNKRVFPNDDSVFKTLYLTINYITAKYTMPIQNWNEVMAHFLIKFEDRI